MTQMSEQEARRKTIRLALAGLASFAILGASVGITDAVFLAKRRALENYERVMERGYFDEYPELFPAPTYPELFPAPTIETRESQPKPNNTYTNEDRDALARMLFGEARGHSNLAKIAVAHTAINRQRDKRWGSNLREVIQQPKQYSCFNRNDPNYRKVLYPPFWNYLEWRRCQEAAKISIESQDPTNGANHYHMDYVRPKWSRGRTPTLVIKEKGRTFKFYRL